MNFTPAMAEWNTNDILKFLEARAGNAVPPSVFKNFFGTPLQTYAFTVSRLAGIEMITDVYDALSAIEQSGGSLKDFQYVLNELLDAAGWTRLSPWHIENIWRTNMASVYNSARMEYQLDVVDEFPFWLFAVTMDNRTCEICRPLGKPPIVLPANHKWFQTHTPPLHFQCRSEIIALTADQVKDYGYRVTKPKDIPEVAVDYKHGFGYRAKLGDDKNISGQINKILEVYKNAA